MMLSMKRGTFMYESIHGGIEVSAVAFLQT